MSRRSNSTTKKEKVRNKIFAPFELTKKATQIESPFVFLLLPLFDRTSSRVDSFNARLPDDLNVQIVVYQNLTRKARVIVQIGFRRQNRFFGIADFARIAR